MEPKKVAKGLCKKCDRHLPPEDLPPEVPISYPPFEPYAPPELLKKKTERQPEKVEESEEESETEKAEESENEEDKARKELNNKYYDNMKKKWELIEEKELLKIKEEEINLEEKEGDILAYKFELKQVEREIKEKKDKLKELYVKQLNLESYEDGEDEMEKEKEKYDTEMTIEMIEGDIELLKSRGNGLELMIVDARRKIMQGRETIAKKRADLKAVKEIRDREIKEEEEGKWPGEPRWLI